MHIKWFIVAGLIIFLTRVLLTPLMPTEPSTLAPDEGTYAVPAYLISRVSNGVTGGARGAVTYTPDHVHSFSLPPPNVGQN